MAGASLAMPGAVAATTGSASDVIEVLIRDFKFVPAHVRAPVGARIRWRNAEKRTPHSVRFASLETGVVESDLLFPGETWERRFDQAGRFDYLCGPHPEMLGRLDIG